MSFSIIGTGMYVPPKIVTNDDLSALVDTSDEWIRQRVGVERRHICTDETATDLACKAALNALENSGCAPEELDVIIAATVSGDMVSPSVSCMVQRRIGADCFAFDINAACSAFIFMLDTAAGFFERGRVKKALIIGTEQMSKIVDWKDRGTCVIFGDGAGAVVLEAGEGYIDSVLTTKGGDEVIKIPHLIGKSPYSTQKPQEPYIFMEGQETFKYAVNAMCSDIRKLLSDNNLTADDIAMIVPHQANKRIIDLAAARLKIPAEKFYVNIQDYGNTSSASIPIALDELSRAGGLKRGDLIILTAFGGGLSNASCIIKWQ
jgi:3-oxoacyl-[acyl-carrier-protein] synthase-3